MSVLQERMVKEAQDARRLRDAAPDLLEALYTAKGCLERLDQTTSSPTAYREICDAIAKATGQS